MAEFRQVKAQALCRICGKWLQKGQDCGVTFYAKDCYIWLCPDCVRSLADLVAKSENELFLKGFE